METQTVQAIFEDGKLVPLTPLALSDHEQVEVVIVRRELPPLDPPLDSNPLWGLFADEPDLIAEIAEEAMRQRETRPLRSSGGKNAP